LCFPESFNTHSIGILCGYVQKLVCAVVCLNHSTFCSHHLNTFTEPQLAMYDELINKPSDEWDIFYWATGQYYVCHCGYMLATVVLSFLRTKAATALARLRLLAIAIVCPSDGHLSVTRVDQSKMVQATITKSSPSAAWRTVVSGTVKLFHKFEGGHPE